MVVVDTNILTYLLIQGDRTKQAQALFAKDSDWRRPRKGIGTWARR